jgi:hypothetical protein
MPPRRRSERQHARHPWNPGPNSASSRPNALGYASDLGTARYFDGHRMRKHPRTSRGTTRNGPAPEWDAHNCPNRSRIPLKDACFFIYKHVKRLRTAYAKSQIYKTTTDTIHRKTSESAGALEKAGRWLSEAPSARMSVLPLACRFVRFAHCLLCSAPSVRFALVCLACAHLSDISHNVRFDTQGGAGHPLNG